MNLAARLSGEARPGELLLTEELHREVADAVVAERMPDLRLKGIEHPVGAWNVVSLRP